jgi:SPP1 gp7 family putative phage head morphogenesis protein
LNYAWSQGSASVDHWINTVADREDRTTFEIPNLKAALKFGNKDASLFHRFKAFASAVITDAELSDAVKESLAMALNEGKSIRDWRKTADEIFDRKGVTRLNNFQAEMIWRTETSMAYGAGQYAKLQEVSDRFPFWEYVTAKDERVRDSHRALDGKIFKVDDRQFYPPLGFNCRCKARPISKRQAANRGITEPDIITPEMRGNLQNAEFIGSKIGNYADFLKHRMKTLPPSAVDLIESELTSIISELKTKDNPEQ